MGFYRNRSLDTGTLSAISCTRETMKTVCLISARLCRESKNSHSNLISFLTKNLAGRRPTRPSRIWYIVFCQMSPSMLTLVQHNQHAEWCCAYIFFCTKYLMVYHLFVPFSVQMRPISHLWYLLWLHNIFIFLIWLAWPTWSRICSSWEWRSCCGCRGCRSCCGRFHGLNKMQGIDVINK